MKKDFTTYTGGYEYYIALEAGCNVVYRRWDDNCDSEPERVYTGSYESCVKCIKRVFAENYAYDNDI